MQFDELVKVWREEESGDVRRTQFESLSDLRGKATRAEKDARSGVRKASIVWLVLVPWFSFMAYVGIQQRSLLFASGCLVLMIGCAAPTVILWRAGKSEIDRTLPVQAAVAKEAERLQELQRMIRRLIDWVMGSLIIGGTLIAAGASESLIVTLVMSAFFILCALAGRRAWRRFTARLRSTILELDSWIGDLERI